MVFKDVEGTKQARKELAERESKLLLALQGNKPSKPKPKPEPKPESSHTSLLGIINVKLGDCAAFFKDEFTDNDAEVELLSSYLPKAEYPGEVNHLKALLEAEMDVLSLQPSSPSYCPYSFMNLSSTSPVYLAYKKKMLKVHKRKLLKSLIKKHGTKPVQLSMVDNSMTDDQVDEMIMTCLQLEQVQDELGGTSDSFEDYGY